MNIIKIDRYEVLRYLGYKGQDINVKLENLIDKSIKKCYEISNPRYCYKIFTCSKEETGILLDGTNTTLKGNSISKYLLKAEKAAVMAATLGVSFDSGVRIQEQVSMTEALILDACGTAYIESLCDAVEEEIIHIAVSESYVTSYRYSPGYGDFPLEQQPEILSLLEANRKIGLTCTRELIMLPRKSVTAVIGFSLENQAGDPCENCNINQTCNFRKEGKTCGY